MRRAESTEYNKLYSKTKSILSPQMFLLVFAANYFDTVMRRAALVNKPPSVDFLLFVISAIRSYITLLLVRRLALFYSLVISSLLMTGKRYIIIYKALYFHRRQLFPYIYSICF